jgi:hypothetical protein
MFAVLRELRSNGAIRGINNFEKCYGLIASVGFKKALPERSKL